MFSGGIRMKRIVSFLVVVTIILSMVVPVYGTETAAAFSDVKPGQWFYEDVMTLTGKGVITGVTKPVNGVGKYDPQGQSDGTDGDDRSGRLRPGS
jgi:hypothetical protein